MASLTNILSGQGRKTPDPQQKYTVQYISSENLQPSEKNFYPIEEIEELADAIELAGGILQPLLVRRLSPGQYEIIAGHRRFAAAKYLIEQGKEQYKLLPCHVQDGDELTAQINLIVTNAQREKSAYVRMREVEELERLLRQLAEGTEDDRERFYKMTGMKEGDKVTARVLRRLVAKKTGLSETNVARLKHINSKLADDARQAFADGRIGISAADEIAGLSEEEQAEAVRQACAGRKPARKGTDRKKDSGKELPGRPEEVNRSMPALPSPPPAETWQETVCVKNSWIADWKEAAGAYLDLYNCDPLLEQKEEWARILQRISDMFRRMLEPGTARD